MTVQHHDILYLPLWRVFPQAGGQVDMQCSVCREHTPDSWTVFTTQVHDPDASFPVNRGYRSLETLTEGGEEDGDSWWEYRVEWMRCANWQCKRLTIRIIREEKHRNPLYVGSLDIWRVLPQFAAARPVDALVEVAQPEMAQDYREASLILDLSPRMSSVLSRRILADLLEVYGKCSGYTIANQIDKFIEQPGHPPTLIENLHYLREIADFSAHTKKDRATGDIIEVSPEEAKWTLEIVDRLFDYLIVTPAHDKKRRDEMDEKLRKAGRKQIKRQEDDR